MPMISIKQHYTSAKNQLSNTVNRVKSKVSNIGFLQKIKHLTPSQWCYFVALFLLFTGSENGELPDERLGLVALIAGIGFSRELFRVIHKIWDSMLGKGIFLLLYAGVANIALALAAVKVNSIAGIEPAILTFSVAFTLMLTLPIWFFFATIVFASVLLLIGNLWLLLTLLLRIVRIKIKAHWEDSVFVIASMIARLVLLVVVMLAMSDMIEPYIDQFSARENGEPIFSISTPKDRARNAQKEALLAEAEAAVAEANKNEADQATSDEAIPENETEEQDDRIIDRLIAAFIYNFETYPSSSCKQAENEKVIAIDENSIFVAAEADNELGYEFYVMPCIHRYSDEPYPP
ncbi:hypothetical protein DRW07_05825 [Alteromonas sediminis]|uniref:Uncharacterized protein n=1 Tax=Alteromonas sediminis TaxID=2259342 RepID=A0A3N5YNC6_9ALTE|nr:hypothetical protein [Alteromonas sediminis]RPJ67061.1 hypothetical protein DRW07_05825 [Alteromonas sediminis]